MTANKVVDPEKPTDEQREAKLADFKPPSGFQFSEQTSVKLLSLAVEREKGMAKWVRAKNHLTKTRKDLDDTEAKISDAIKHEDPTGTLYTANG